MPLRLELGALTVEVERHEEATALLRGWLRHLSNTEIAELLGVTDKTVRRWRRQGRLPGGTSGQVMLLHLLGHPGAGVATAWAAVASAGVPR